MPLCLIFFARKFDNMNLWIYFQLFSISLLLGSLYLSLLHFPVMLFNKLIIGLVTPFLFLLQSLYHFFLRSQLFLTINILSFNNTPFYWEQQTLEYLIVLLSDVFIDILSVLFLSNKIGILRFYVLLFQVVKSN